VKLLLDSCVWGGVPAELRASGFDVAWAGEWDRDPGDEEILRRAVDESRVLVTLDKDFGHLAIALDRPHPAIIRLVGIGARQQGPLIVHLVQAYPTELAQAALLTAEPGRVRIRAKPPGPPTSKEGA
jgi:predicted nuclease of predicted toxin-antitoxin system